MPELPERVSLAVRSRILEEMVRDEVTGGAHVAHRDTVSAILVRGPQRMLVTVDEDGSLHVERLSGPRPRRLRSLVLAMIAVAVVLLAVVLLAQFAMPGP